MKSNNRILEPISESKDLVVIPNKYVLILRSIANSIFGELSFYEIVGSLTTEDEHNEGIEDVETWINTLWDWIYRVEYKGDCTHYWRIAEDKRHLFYRK